MAAIGGAADRDADRDANREMAFGGRTLDATSGTGPPRDRWLAAVALGGRGRYGAAWALLGPLIRDPAVPSAVRAHAAVTRAAHLRQLGGHLPARRWDGLGLALAGPAKSGAGAASEPASDRAPAPGADYAGDVAGARVDALLGLAADALGPMELDLTERLLAAAEPLVAAHPSWRPAVRLGWVRAELALARDRPGPALRHAELALAGARAAGAVRHQVKSELVALVARSCAGDAVHPELRELCHRTSAAGLRSLEWPIMLLLARGEGTAGAAGSSLHRHHYHQLFTSIRRGCDPHGRSVLDLSPWVAGLVNP